LTSIRFIDLYITNIEYSSETQGLPSSEIEIMLLIIGRRAGVFVRNTLRPSVLGLTECHSYLTRYLRALMAAGTPLFSGWGSGLLTRPASATAGVVARKELKPAAEEA